MAVASTPQSTFVGGVTAAAGPSRVQRAGLHRHRLFHGEADLRQQQVPIGLLAQNWGGTSIHPWIPANYLRTLADYTPTVDTLSATTSPALRPARSTMRWSPRPPGFRSRAPSGIRAKTRLTLYGVSALGRPQIPGHAQAIPGGHARGVSVSRTCPFVLVQLSTNGSNTTPVQSSTTTLFAEVREAQLNTALGDSNARVVTTVDCGFWRIQRRHSPYRQADPRQTRRPGRARPCLRTNHRLPHTDLQPRHGGGQHPALLYRPGRQRSDGRPQATGLSQNAAPSPSPVSEVSGGTLTGFSIAGSDKTCLPPRPRTTTATKYGGRVEPQRPQPLYVRYGCAITLGTPPPAPRCAPLPENPEQLHGRGRRAVFPVSQ